MRIGFFDNGIGFRGTTRAILDYAECLEDNSEKYQTSFLSKTAQQIINKYIRDS